MPSALHTTYFLSTGSDSNTNTNTLLKHSHLSPITYLMEMVPRDAVLVRKVPESRIREVRVTGRSDGTVACTEEFVLGNNRPLVVAAEVQAIPSYRIPQAGG
jgi:hypothetical protein